jgi:hypothetical protein
MSQPVVVTIPHQLGKQEATRRLQTGLGKLRTSFGSTVTALDENWTGDHLDFRWGVLGQSVSGGLDVAEDHVRLEIQLPWLLAKLAEKAKTHIQSQGKLLLE